MGTKKVICSLNDKGEVPGDLGQLEDGQKEFHHSLTGSLIEANL